MSHKDDGRSHYWTALKGYPWRYCRYCGLVALGNPISQWAAKKDCNYKDLPAYKRWQKTGVI